MADRSNLCPTTHKRSFGSLKRTHRGNSRIDRVNLNLSRTRVNKAVVKPLLSSRYRAMIISLIDQRNFVDEGIIEGEGETFPLPVRCREAISFDCAVALYIGIRKKSEYPTGSTRRAGKKSAARTERQREREREAARRP